MDFIPTGFLTIRDAVKRLLRATHGVDWGSREIVLENDATDIPGTTDETGKPLQGQRFDRAAILESSQQQRDAEQQIFGAFRDGALVGFVEIGRPVPLDYWTTPNGTTTMLNGILDIQNFAWAEDQKWHDHRVLVDKKALDKWIRALPASSNKAPIRKSDPVKDLLIENKINSVLTAARRLLSSPGSLPGRNQAARLLFDDPQVKNISYSKATIRKILNGSYSASKRLGIPGHPGIDPRAK